jgi:hypothetical protein
MSACSQKNISQKKIARHLSTSSISCIVGPTMLSLIKKNAIAVDAENEANGGYYQQFLWSPKIESGWAK